MQASRTLPASEIVELYKAHFSPHCLMVTILAATETGTFRRYFVDQDTEITGSFVPVG